MTPKFKCKVAILSIQDWGIDQLGYQLYGLSEDEVKIVEGTACVFSYSDGELKENL